MTATAKAAGFPAWLARASALTEDKLREVLDGAGAPPPLDAAMRYAALGGGKRLRPAVVFAVAGADGDVLADADATAAACAVELVHCYSLAHDDLPCMDDDDERRGRASCHRAHGEAMALLAGDCLHSLAFEVLADSALPADAVKILAAAAGAGGMGGGQALDIAGDDDSADALAAMCRLKTGALFDAAVRLGALCRRASAPADDDALGAFAREFGLLFQLANDIGGRAKDLKSGKKTYATAHPDGVRARALAARQNAVAALRGRFPRLADIARAVYAE